MEAVRKWEESEMTGAKVRNPIIFMRMSTRIGKDFQSEKSDNFHENVKNVDNDWQI